MTRPAIPANDETYRIGYLWRALAVCLIVGLLSFTARHFTLDDALIYARYVRNALQGHGLVFNPGQPVNALTSLLHTWLLLGFSWLLHGKVLLAQTLLSAVCLASAALIAEQIIPLSGIFLSASAYFYLCNGMETTLFLLLLVLCVQAYASDRMDWLPLLCTLCALTRFEGAALAVVLAWKLWKQHRLPRLRAYLPPLLLVALYLAFNLHFYGSMLPQSATAKFGQGLSGYWGRWPMAFLRVPPRSISRWPAPGSTLRPSLSSPGSARGIRDSRSSDPYSCRSSFCSLPSTSSSISPATTGTTRRSSSS
jgi:hypothetical protein